MVPPVEARQPLTDSGTPRPHLPDPQHDRHVSFPDDVSESLPPLRSLPPEAWAPRGGERPGTVESQGQPSAPGFLTAPPPRPRVRRRSSNRGAGVIAALVVVPLFLGLLNGGAGGSSADDGGYSTEYGADPAWQGNYGDVPAGVTIMPVADEATVAALLPDTTTVQGVPADTTQVRIEVVASAGDTVNLEILGPDGLLETTLDEPLPLARIATSPVDESTTMHVHAKTASSETELQCRVYAGTVLVALDTSRTFVTCSVTW